MNRNWDIMGIVVLTKEVHVTIEISDSLRDWIEYQTKVGGHKNGADYVENMIRKQQQARQRIDDALREGLNSGEAIEVNEAFWAERWRELEEVLDSRKDSAT